MTAPDPPPNRLRTLLRTGAGLAARKAATSAASAAVTILGWPVILAVTAAIAVVAILLLVALLVALAKMGDEREYFAYQCESRLGYSVGASATLTVVPHLQASISADINPQDQWEITALQPATTTTTPSAAPTSTTRPAPSATSTSTTTPTNPYASLSIPASTDDRTRACVEALKTGTLIATPASEQGTAAGLQAAVIANRQIGLTATATDGDLLGATNNAFSAPNLVRYAYYEATKGKVDLPTTPAEQITIGDRVDPTATSPGDLVFFNFTPTEGPTAVMIAVTATLGVDATAIGQPIALAVLPTGNVITKRPYPKEATP